MIATESDPSVPLTTGSVWRHRRERAVVSRRQWLLLLALFAGCGREPSQTNPAVTGPHGSPAIPIPGGVGYAEARFESSSVETSKQKEKGKGNSTRIVIYFLATDGKTALVPPPENVRIVVGMPGTDAFAKNYTKTYPLASESEGPDPPQSTRFVSAPLRVPEQRMTGHVEAAIRDRDVSFPLVLSAGSGH